MRICGPLHKIHCNLTVSHSLWVFIREWRRKTATLTLTATRIRWRALGLWLLRLRLDRLWLMSLLAVAVLFPFTFLVGQLPILRGHGHLVGLFYFEEHRRVGTVLHGPRFTKRGWTIFSSQHYDVTKTACGLLWVGNCKSQSPFLGVELDRGLLKLSLPVFGFHTNPVRVVPQLVLLQAYLCGEHCFTVGAAVTQLFSYGGLIQIQTWERGDLKFPPNTKWNDSG